MSYTERVLLENGTSAPIQVEIQNTLPAGFSANFPQGSTIVLPAEHSSYYSFQLTSNGKGVIGSASGLIEFKVLNTKVGSQGVTYIPAFQIPVGTLLAGASGHVTVNAINVDNKTPATGQIQIDYLGTKGIQSTVFSELGSSISAELAPGTYVASFRVPNLVSKNVPFTVATNQSTSVEIPINGIQYFLAGVQPLGHDKRAPSAVRLVSVVVNGLQRYVGAVNLSVVVRHNGTIVDRYQFAHLTELPSGTTQQEANYVPAGGFSGGTWKFAFVLTTANARVPYPHVIAFGIPASTPWAFVFGVVVVILLVIGAAWWWFKSGRKKQRKIARHIRH